jgi:hypothetical protein
VKALNSSPTTEKKEEEELFAEHLQRSRPLEDWEWGR